MANSLHTRIRRLEQESASTVAAHIWCHMDQDWDAAIAAHLARRPEDAGKRFFVYRWLSEEPAP